MGVLTPSDFPLSSLANDEERLVVDAFCDRLTDGWVVLPSVEIRTDGRDHELDVVLIHPGDGIAVIEVKGHRPSIEGGAWMAGGRRMEPQPVSQARANAYALRDVIRTLHPSLEAVQVEYAVAFPNVESVAGALPVDVDASQVLTCRDLESPLDAVELLLARGRFHTVGEDNVARIVEHLRPDCDFDYTFEARARLARARLEAICRQQVEALAGLDANRRVCVTGAAGTGKTRLAVEWARRARRRGERVLLTCYNVPLADSITERFPFDTEIRVGGFLDVARNLEGMPHLAVPDGADQAWWEDVQIPFLVDHWDEVTERFDTIVVDEAQDFDPTWISLLERALDPDGPRRLLLVADEAQQLYRRGFTLPDPDSGWVRCHLSANCRNTFEIASLLQRSFAGATAPVGGPETESLHPVVAADVDDAVDRVGDAIDDLEERGHGADRILVATFTSSVRDRLRDTYAFVRWEDREPFAIVCENVHRVKGLEFDHVILVAHDDTVADELLYVGLSRSVMSATVIGPEAVVGRL